MELDMNPGVDHSQHGAGGGHDMVFHFGINEKVLFKGWEIVTEGGMVGSCFAVFMLGLFFEMLKSFRGFLARRDARRPRETIDVDAVQVKVRVASRTTRESALREMGSRGHIIQSLLHVLQFFLGYLLMLIFMTYNVWLCIAVVLGVGFGYFFFGWCHRAMQDEVNGDCCH